MNDKFDELAKGMARSVTRRAALKKFGVGIAGVVLASIGLANKAEAMKAARQCEIDSQGNYTGVCVGYNGRSTSGIVPSCGWFPSANCPAGAAGSGQTHNLCERIVDWRSSC